MRQNNFDIVRLILASIVVLVHSEDLTSSPSLVGMTRFLSSHLAVEGFFAISGFLIFASYERCTSLREYFTNRAWRILPGYWLSTVFCLLIAFSLGCFDVGKFLFANLTFANFLHPGIPGVFEHNPTNPDMNGALWTIKIEVMFYISVPIIVWLCRRLNRDAVLWTLFFASIAYRVLLANHEKASIQLPGQLSFFLIGTIIYYHLAFFKKHGKWIALLAAVCYGLHLWTGWFALRPAPIGVFILGASLLLPQIKGPTRWGDFSYGTYILHYPILQMIIAAGLFYVHPWLALLLSIGLVMIAATLSWFFVEKPSLAHAKSRRLRMSALGETPNYPPAVP
jgi:peptidoglycan/LPS O-acetylase OafA/YrhL